VANNQGQTRWRWDQQEPFGVSPANENPSGLGAFEFPLRFPGQYADKETNLYYNYFRDFDPALGRYVQSDPIGFAGGSLSLYAYVASNPLAWTDPTGLALECGCIPGTTRCSKCICRCTVACVDIQPPRPPFDPGGWVPGSGGVGIKIWEDPNCNKNACPVLGPGVV